MHASEAGELSFNGISLPKNRGTSGFAQCLVGSSWVGEHIIFKECLRRCCVREEALQSSLRWAVERGREGSWKDWKCLQDMVSSGARRVSGSNLAREKYVFPVLM